MKDPSDTVQLGKLVVNLRLTLSEVKRLIKAIHVVETLYGTDSKKLRKKIRSQVLKNNQTISLVKGSR